MKRGKVLTLFILSILVLSFFATIVSANAFTDGIGKFSEVVKDPLLDFTANENLFVKTLFFFLVFLIIVTILGIMPLFEEARLIKVLVALIITTLSVYFLPTELVSSMLNPYSALGVAIISIIPFILMWLFTTTMITNSFFRKIAWMFYAIALLALSVVSGIDATGVSGNIYSWSYGLASTLALAMVFFSSWIEANIWKGKMEDAEAENAKTLQQQIALDNIEKAKAEKRYNLPGLRKKN